MLNSTRHRSKGERITQNLIPRLQTSTLHHQHDGASAAIQCHTVFVASVFRNLHLALANRAGRRVLDIVAIKTSRAHELDGLINARLGDGVGCLDVAGDGGSDGVGEEGVGGADRSECGDGGQGQFSKSSSGHFGNLFVGLRRDDGEEIMCGYL